MSVSTRSNRANESVRSVERALDLLKVLEKSDRPLGVTELSVAARMPKTTAHRLLSALDSRGFVQKDQERYRLGNGVVSLASAFLSADSLVRSASPVLEELAQISGETASLFVREGFDRVILQRVDSPHALRYTVRIGQRFPLYGGAAGQVLMAAMPQDELDSYLERLGEFRLAGGLVLSKLEMIARLDRVRLQGFAINPGETESGVVCVAAPIRRADGRTIAAIAVTGPPSRMTPEKVEHLSIEVRRAARQIGESFL